MSQWAHINGTIRYDAIRQFGMPSHPKHFLGKTWGFVDCEEQGTRQECNVPYGSEGSLQYEIFENPDRSALAAYQVAFRGDLRDKGDEIFQEMEAYLKCITDGQMIRQGVFHIEVESGETKVYVYFDPKKCWVEL